MNLDLVMWQQFEGNNLQELCSFQPEENDTVTSKGHDFWLGYLFGLKFYELCLEEFTVVLI